MSAPWQQLVARILIAEIGGRRPETVYETAERAAAKIREMQAQRDEAIATSWVELASVAKALGYKRADSPDFGEVDSVGVWELARATVELARLVARSECCDGDDTAWTNETVSAVKRWRQAIGEKP
jgi:hypothetical protein